MLGKYLYTLSTGKPIATMGRWFTKTMLLALAEAADDLSSEEEARIMSAFEGESFEDDKNLSTKEEAEIGRRIIEAGPVEDEE